MKYNWKLKNNQYIDVSLLKYMSRCMSLIHFIYQYTMHTIIYYLIKELKLQVYHFQLTSDIMLKSYK